MEGKENDTGNTDVIGIIFGNSCDDRSGFENPDTYIIALLLAALITALVGRMSPADAITAIQDGFGNTLKSTGIIMLITGAGGALGNVVKVSGIGEVLGEMVVSWPIPAILIPVIIAALMRIALGSATVAITTATSLTAPLAPVLGLPAVLLAQASCIGAASLLYLQKQ